MAKITITVRFQNSLFRADSAGEAMAYIEVRKNQYLKHEEATKIAKIVNEIVDDDFALSIKKLAYFIGEDFKKYENMETEEILNLFIESLMKGTI